MAFGSFNKDLKDLVGLKSIILLFFLTGIFSETAAQPSEADLWYQKLDSFLIKPTPNKLDDFKKEIVTLNAASKEAKLAQVITYCNIGYYAQKYNRLTEGIAYYEKAKSVFFNQKLSGYDIIEYCLKPLGNLYTQINALSEAENTIKHYLLLAQKQGSKLQEASALLNLSIVYKSLRRYDKAITLLKQAQALTPNNLLVYLQLAENYIKKENFSRAEILLKKAESQFPKFSKTYLLLAEIAGKKKHYQKAEAFYKKAIALQQQNPKTSRRELAKTYLLLAKLQLNKNDFSRASEHVTKTYQTIIPTFSNHQLIPEKSQLFAENTLLDALDVQARLFTLQNQPDKAVLSYERANEVSHLLISQATLRQSKINSQTQRKNRFEKMLRLIYEQYQTTKKTEWLQKSVAIDAESKSFVVNENQRLLNRLKKHLSDSLVKQYFEINTRLEQIKTRLETLQSTHFSQPDSLLKWQKNYSGLLTLQREIFSRLKDTFPNIILEKETVSLKTIQEILQQSNQTVVSYFFGTNQVFQWIIDRENVVFNRIISQKKERDSLFDLCVKMNAFFTNASEINNHPQAFFTTAHQLFTRLNLPEKEKITLIPDGILSFIPFDALVTHSVETYNYATVPFLVKQSEISYRLSVSNLVEEENLPVEATTILGVFPQFKNSDKELTYSIQEAEVIASRFQSKLLKNKNATTQKFLNYASNFDVIHLSTHARGGTFTTPPVIEFIDGELSVNSLYGLQLNTHLVILSACETGVGKLIKGEGVINLARGFNYAGVQQVLFTLWNVNDYATAQIMQGFYKNLSDNMPSTQALTLSKRAYIKDKNIENNKKSPFYWASFVYYGKPVLVKSRTILTWQWALLLSVLFGVLILLWLKRLYNRNR